jgi:2-dehydro-3-deoxyphosphogluconate aldolase / (4S)-4-hydroxy-2-oxoglutarate aldolase
MTRAEVRTRIEEVGILPAIRVSSPADALFSAEAVYQSGIPVAEITMTTPGAIEVISRITRDLPEMIVGAGTVLDLDTAQRCLDAGALFLTSTGLVMDVVEFALANEVAVFPGALSPTEIIAAWRAGSDFVKVFPCSANGGYRYIRALKVPLPQIPMIASGGVNQQTAFDFIRAGAAVLGIGAELMPPEALRARNQKQIRELARRYLGMVKDARELMTGGTT